MGEDVFLRIEKTRARPVLITQKIKEGVQVVEQLEKHPKIYASFVFKGSCKNECVA